MDPWPGQRNEPKAPDKNIDALNPKDNNIIMKIQPETQYPGCGKADNYNARVMPSNKDSSVSSLNEPDLKALLEEAMAYKRPKDIQGKSELFKELLHSVECEKKFSVMSRSEKQATRKPRRKQINKKEATEKPPSENHFQDLIVHVSECDVSTKRQVKYSLKCSPANVPQVVPVNAVTVCDENNPEVAALIQNGSFENLEQIQQFIANEANVYQIQAKEPVDSRVGFPLTISPYGEKTPEEGEARISVKDISTLTCPPKDSTELSVRENLSDSKKSLDENGNAVGGSRVDNLTERKSKARRLKARNDKNTILSQHIEGHRSDIAQDIDALMKYIESPKNADAKSSRQRNSVGYSKQNTRINNKIAPVRDKSTDTFSRKSPKNKDDTMHKSSSLEEVSISKFEDLTQTFPVTDEKNKITKKPSNDKTIWKSNVNLKYDKDLHVSEVPLAVRSDKTEPEIIDSDFLPVTKKNRKKKCAYESNLRNKTMKTGDYHRTDKALSSYMRKSQELDSFHGPTREFQRRKSISSVPSSDKSGDTSDMDSVHSFPVSSSKGKGMKGNVSVSSGSTPQISYADIARSAPSPTRNELSPKCKSNVDQLGDFDEQHNFSSHEPIPTVIFQLPSRKEPVENSIKSREEYPPLEIKTVDKNMSQCDLFVEYTMVVPKRNPPVEASYINVEETVLIEMPPPKHETSVLDNTNLVVDSHLSNKRPPVILLNTSNETNDVNDLEFGFEVNEQLLNNSEKIKNSGLINIDSNCGRICVSPNPLDQDNIEPKKTEYRELPDDSESHILSANHLKLVDYITAEWKAVEDEFKSGSGKVVYYRP